jgi:hypothetical protein
MKPYAPATAAADMFLPTAFLDAVGFALSSGDAVGVWRSLLPQVQSLCRAAVARHHPDAGGGHEAFLAATEAREYVTCPAFPADLWRSYAPRRDHVILPRGVFAFRDPAFLRRNEDGAL